MLYVTNDGHKFIATDEADLIRLLHADSYAPADDDEHFMQDMAKRVKEQLNVVIPTDSPAEFVAGLIKVGLVEEVNE